MISSEFNGIQLVDCGKQILTNYNDTEKLSIIWYLLEEKYGFNKLRFLSDSSQTIAPETSKEIIKDFQLLNEGTPVQYLVGHAYFMGEKFKVTNSVLIPRPETEELVQHCIDHYNNHAPHNIADICTGSGCIAISLSIAFPTSNVHAYDISTAALSIAEENNQLLQSSVQFHICDVLKENPFVENSLDCIVSNPPYVLDSEKKDMRTNVLDHEPHLALFVEDNHALIFYTRILEIGLKALKNKGVVFFEINEQKGEEIKKEALALGYAKASILKDIHGKDRMVKVIKG